MRGDSGGDARPINYTLETINAAATVIASVDNHLHQPHHLQKKSWASWLSIYWCFGHGKNSRKRIGHAVLVTPERTPSSGANAAATTESSTTQAPINIPFPFAAPPSSPASFLHSEPPSAAQSPGAILSLTSVSATVYSPSPPLSIFAIGPYAYETQLVSPPVFSTFTTEPSTAPFTPPPESLHLTTPSSPEVPFAQLLDPNNKNSDNTYQRFPISHYDFHSYQLHPGSPVGQLVSPRSAFSASGTSSFPDTEFTSYGSLLLDPPKPLNFDKLSTHENHETHQGSGSLTPDAASSTTQAGFLPIIMPPHPRNNCLNEISVNHSVAIKVSAQEVHSNFKSDAPGADKEDNSRLVLVTETSSDALEHSIDDGDMERVHHQDECMTFSSAKEFNFDNAEGGDSPTPNIVTDWWANEKVASKEEGSSHNWSFFPIIQPHVG